MVDHDLYWRWDNDPGQPVEHLTWSVDSNGDLAFTPAPGAVEGWTFAKPLVRDQCPELTTALATRRGWHGCGDSIPPQ